jgi:hypothetical protein
MTTYTPQFAEAFITRLYQIASQEEGVISRTSLSPDTQSARRAADDIRLAAVNQNERELILTIGDALGHRAYKLLDALHMAGKESVPSYLSRRGAHHDKAMQFLRVLRTMEADSPSDMNLLVTTSGKEGVMKKLIDYYGSFFDILKTGRISTADHIDPQDYASMGLPLPEEAKRPKVIENLAGHLYAAYQDGADKRFDGSPVRIPLPTPGNEAWMTWMLGYAAKFHYGSDLEDRRIGALSFPYFLHVTTGIAPQDARMTVFAAINGEDDILRTVGRSSYDAGIATTLKNIIAGGYEGDVQPELERIIAHRNVYEQALEDGTLEREELAILREFLRGVEGVRHPEALATLLSTTPVEHPGYALPKRPSRGGGVIEDDDVICSTPRVYIPAPRAEPEPQKATALPIRILFDYAKS